MHWAQLLVGSAPTVGVRLCGADAKRMLVPMRRGRFRGTFRGTPMRRLLRLCEAYAGGDAVLRTHRSVRVDPELLAELDRQGLVPASFSDQVEAALWLLVRAAADEQTRHAVGLVGADRHHAKQIYHRLHGRAVEPSGWRLMGPLVPSMTPPEAPPLVVTVDGERARVQLLCSAPHDDLGERVGELGADDVGILLAAVGRLVAA